MQWVETTREIGRRSEEPGTRSARVARTKRVRGFGRAAQRLFGRINGRSTGAGRVRPTRCDPSWSDAIDAKVAMPVKDASPVTRPPASQRRLGPT